MHTRGFLFLLLSSVVLLFQPACGGVVGPSQNTIESFSGTVDPQGDSPEHEFQVSRNGEVEIRLTSLQPAASGVFLQLILARFAGGSCNQFIALGIAAPNAVALTGAIETGRYCMGLFDEGVLTERVAYTLQVSHP